MPDPDLGDYIKAVRALLDELNQGVASGLITQRALSLMLTADMLTRQLERGLVVVE